MRHFSLALAILCISMSSSAREHSTHNTKKGVPAYYNSITFCFPTYMEMGIYPGIDIGLEYTRFLDRKGHYSASMNITQILWAGTFEQGEYYSTGTRANIKGTLFCPGVLYHPLGNRHRADLAAGVSMPMGSLNRQDSYRPGNSGDVYTIKSTERLTALLFGAQLTLQTGGQFVFAFHGSFGPILSGSEKTKGNMGEVGLKIGGRF